jgi:hypothetical protein
MPGAGTDKTRNWVEAAGPVIILVEPQLGENIGAAARVMANFGLGRLRLVKPRDGWPNTQAQRSASGADRILDEAALFDDLTAAIADCTVVLATTARAHDQAKPVLGPDEAASSPFRSIPRLRRSTSPRRSRSSPTSGSSLRPAACFLSPCRGNRSRLARSRCRRSL